MSISLMKLVWQLQAPPTPKFVLLAMADMAKDAGHCWPSIETLCKRTGFGRTAVIDAIRWIEGQGIVRADRSNGRKSAYTIVPEVLRAAVGEGVETSPPPGPVCEANQSAKRTGPANEPVREADDTSPGGGPPPVREADTNPHLTIKEPKDMSGTPEVDPDSPAGLIEYLNRKAGKRFRPVEANIRLAKARLGEASAAEIRAVIDARCLQWRGNPKMAEYLRPETLFGATKFAQYLGELDADQPGQPASGAWWLRAGYGDEASARKAGAQPEATA